MQTAPIWETLLALAGTIGLSALMARVFLDAIRKKPPPPVDTSADATEDGSGQ